MSCVRLLPSVLSGEVSVPPSKSEAHRALICSALAGRTELPTLGGPLCDDLLATRDALRQLLSSGGNPVEIDCRESGSTLRFLIPLAAALGVPARFTGRGRLPERPLGVYFDCLPEHGVQLTRGASGLPLRVEGRLTPGRFFLPGGVSSQFVTGLLLSLPLLSGDSEIILTSPLASAPYAALTLRVMRAFGVSAGQTENGWLVPGNCRYRPNPAFRVERDWSQAAFFLAAGTLGGHLTLSGLTRDSCQGDCAAENLFRRLGAKISWCGNTLSVEPGQLPDSIPELSAEQIPDLVPALAAAAALLPGRKTVISHAGRLRLKESDRLSAAADGLNALGGSVREEPDGLVIRGVERLRGGQAEGRNDHRIVMALSVAALRAEHETILSDAESVRKSYPDFFADYNRLGGKAYELGEHPATDHIR